MKNKPRIITGAIHEDERGRLCFVNDFVFNDVKRFYIIRHESIEIIRAWQGHKKEKKYFYVPQGSFLIAAVFIDNWDNPDSNLLVNKFVLSEDKSNVLEIPPGFANGFKALQPNSQLLVFSSSSLDESKNDDFRFPKEYWYNWKL